MPVVLTRCLLSVSWRRLSVMWRVMGRLVRCHEWSLTGRRVRRVRVRLRACVSCSDYRSGCVRRVVTGRVIRDLRERLDHVTRKILRYPLDRFLIDALKNKQINFRVSFFDSTLTIDEIEKLLSTYGKW